MNKEELSNNVSGLTEEQIGRIVELSNNEIAQIRESVTNEVTGSIYGNIDKDFEELGYKKPSGKKTYDHVKETVAMLKGHGDKNAELEAEVARLNALVAKGGDNEELKAQLKKLETSLGDVNAQLAQERESHASDIAKHEEAMLRYRFDLAVKDALSGIKFKDGVGERTRELMIAEACKEVLKDGRTYEFADNGDMIFRDANGTILTNPNDMHHPFTLKGLLAETSAMGEIMDVRNVGGAGSKGGKTPTGGGIDISGMNRVQADEAIEEYLFSKGLTRDSDEFQEQKSKLRSELGVDKLKLY